MRVTPSRLAVLALLREVDHPLTHAEVVERLAGREWDPATLFRNLHDLSEADLVRRADMGDHVWRYEAVRGEHDVTRHPHFVCIACGAVECMPQLELALPKGKLPRALKLKQVDIQLRGLCDACS
jgi:Fur family transcriptional regulator, ferric uptake regulator